MTEHVQSWADKPTTAVEWFARIKSGSITEAELEEYRALTANDPRFREEQRKLEATWSTAGALHDDPDIQRIAQLTTDADKPGRQFFTRRWIEGATGIAAALVLIVATLFISQQPDLHSQVSHYATVIGEQEAVTLSDRSSVTLNTATELRVQYTGTLRKAELMAGEATFEVAHDAGIPFEVHANGGVIRVLGTTFNVQLFDDGSTRVSVLEGRVEVRTGEAPKSRQASVQLEPGQAVEFRANELSGVTRADLDRIEGWHSGRIKFHDWPLRQLLVEYNRYTDEILYVEPAAEGIRFSGSFSLHNKEELIQAIEEAFHITVHRRTRSPSS